MFGKGVTLFTMFGFSVRADASWLVIVVLVVWSLAGGVFPEEYPGLSWMTYVLMGLAGAMGLFVSIVVHELCHSLVARRFGLPIRGITLFIFGGVAEMSDEPPSATAELWMALAGPAASVVIAAAFWSASIAGAVLDWPLVAVGVLRWIGLINALLVVFNLIPGFPLDGGRVLRSLLWQWKGDLRWATRAASRVGSLVGIGLIGLGFVSLLMRNPIGGLWWILIGMFLRFAAKQGYQQVLIRQFLRGEPLRRFMSSEPVTVSPAVSVQALVEDYIYRYHFKMFPVVDQDRLVGCVSTQQARQVPHDQWGSYTVGQVAQPCGAENTIEADRDALEALTLMNRNQVSRLLVASDGRLVGILSLKDLLKFLALKLELESGEPAR